jgi:hypothetical protein
MIMEIKTPKQVLQAIIENGICPPAVCHLCPLEKFKLRENSLSHLSCWAAIMGDMSISNTGYENVTAAYKKAATEKMIQLEIEELLKGDTE